MARKPDAHLPLDNRFGPWMREGIMIFSAYTRQYARVGDRFWAFGDQFFVTGVHRFPLGAIARRGHRYHGFVTPQQFINYWNDYHPIKGFVPNQLVYLHWFSLMDPTVAKTVTALNWCPFCPIGTTPGPGISCRHFIGYAGQVEPHPDDVMVQTPVSQRIYRKRSGSESEFSESVRAARECGQSYR